MLFVFFHIFLLLFALSLLHLPALHQIRISSSRWKVLFHLCTLDSVRKAFFRKKTILSVIKNSAADYWTPFGLTWTRQYHIYAFSYLSFVSCIIVYVVIVYPFVEAKVVASEYTKKCYTYFDSLSHKAIHQSFHEESQKRKSHSNLQEKASFLSFFLLLDEAQEHYLSSLCSLLLA